MGIARKSLAMPIRFHCEHCGQFLSAETRKAGAELRCPKCRQKLRVPDQSEQQTAPPAPPPVKNSAQPEAGDWGQFMVFDRDAELVYEHPEPVAAAKAPVAQSTSNDKVAIARSVIYMQGALLAAVALICFALGVIVGGAAPMQSAQQAEPQPCVVTGRIEYVAEDGRRAADSGAVALILPRDARPEFDEKTSIDSLLPGAPPPNDADPALAVVRQFGGDYDRADENGNYELHVPDRGKYFVLFVSQNRRSRNAAPSRTQIAQLGRYFLPMDPFLDQREFSWEEQSVTRDRTLDYRFQ